MNEQETDSQDANQDKQRQEHGEDASQPEYRPESKKLDRFNGKDKDGNTVAWEW